ncbi:MAG: threonine dehydratase [Nocardioidaceae bacterium]|jgi:threonine dehydratase|nr:threonine dehydratase [Nocardioidaceae bacterium]
MATTVTLDDVRAAAARIDGRCVRTPLLPAGWTGVEGLWLKPECLQPTGAFKLRGATNAVEMLEPGRRARGVVTHSSGNHGWALAHAARVAGVPATVVVPHGSNPVKVEAIVAAGARVVAVPVDERESTCAEIAARTGAAEIPPFDDSDVVAGQGTVGLEIAADLPDVETVLVPVGGGGLIAGVAVAVKALAPHARVIGCEPALAGDAAESVRTGRLTAWPSTETARTSADGLRSSSLGRLNWELIERLVDDIVTVDEEAVESATRELVTRSRLVVEPSGAVTLAALRQRRDDLPRGPTVAVVSGGNIDPAVLRRLLEVDP